MKLPLLLILGNILFWGLWGFFSKLAVSKIGFHAGLYYAITLFTFIATYLFFTKQLLPFNFGSQGILFALLAGISGGTATIFLYLLLGKNPAGLVVAITALYPIVTLILSMIFLKETLTLPQTVGFALALVALVLMNL